MICFVIFTVLLVILQFEAWGRGGALECVQLVTHCQLPMTTATYQAAFIPSLDVFYGPYINILYIANSVVYNHSLILQMVNAASAI